MTGERRHSNTRSVGMVATHLRGFDMAMVETGYRYGELYWAGQDSNWGYAEYQAGKIRTAIENDLRRRPLRTKSAETFLTIALPAVQAAIKERDPALLRERLGTLRSTCIAAMKPKKPSLFGWENHKSERSRRSSSRDRYGVDSRNDLPRGERCTRDRRASCQR